MAFPSASAWPIFLFAESKIRWKVLWEIRMDMADSTCSRFSAYLSRIASHSSKANTTDLNEAGETPDGLNCVTLIRPAIRRGFLGLATLRFQY